MNWGKAEFKKNINMYNILAEVQFSRATPGPVFTHRCCSNFALYILLKPCLTRADAT